MLAPRYRFENAEIFGVSGYVEDRNHVLDRESQIRTIRDRSALKRNGAFVRPAGRTLLEVKVLYIRDAGKC
jgi:hypothetical protein